MMPLRSKCAGAGSYGWLLHPVGVLLRGSRESVFVSARYTAEKPRFPVLADDEGHAPPASTLSTSIEFGLRSLASGNPWIIGEPLFQQRLPQPSLIHPQKPVTPGEGALPQIQWIKQVPQPRLHLSSPCSDHLLKGTRRCDDLGLFYSVKQKACLLTVCFNLLILSDN